MFWGRSPRTIEVSCGNTVSSEYMRQVRDLLQGAVDVAPQIQIRTLDAIAPIFIPSDPTAAVPPRNVLLEILEILQRIEILLTPAKPARRKKGR